MLIGSDTSSVRMINIAITSAESAKDRWQDPAQMIPWEAAQVCAALFAEKLPLKDFPGAHRPGGYLCLDEWGCVRGFSSCI